MEEPDAGNPHVRFCEGESQQWPIYSTNNMNPDHLVVFANTSCSGRFKKAIPIGEYRDGAFRVKKQVLEQWGGIDVKNGFIQRSVRPPWFSNPLRFLDWLKSYEVDLINSNLE